MSRKKKSEQRSMTHELNKRMPSLSLYLKIFSEETETCDRVMVVKNISTFTQGGASCLSSALDKVGL